MVLPIYEVALWNESVYDALTSDPARSECSVHVA